MSNDDLRSEGRIKLRDGRRLGFAEFGAPHGPVIVWFHGTPGSSHQIPPAARVAAHRRGVRLIGVERPGYGLSTPHVYGSVRDFADDVANLADALGIGRFAVVALSGGGPYALACGHRFPERVPGVALLGGVAPCVGAEAIGGGLASVAVRFRPLLPLLCEPVGWLLRGATRSLSPVADLAAPIALRLILPPEDTRTLADPALRRVFVRDAMRASRRWFGGPLYDATLFTRPWGFSLADVRVPVQIWQGDADRIVPLVHAVHQSRLLPDATVHVRPREGHLGTLAAADEILQSLLERWPDRGGDTMRAS